MNRIAVRTLVAAIVGVAALASHAQERVEKQRGMSYLSGNPAPDAKIEYGSEESTQALKELKALGVEWIAIVPYGFQPNPSDTAIRWGQPNVPETDENLRKVTAQAHALGLKVMLKPHLRLQPPYWAGHIQQRTEELWGKWFSSYGEFIGHYAVLARVARVDAFCIGNELKRASYRQADWRGLIKNVRAVYSGPLTYGANFDEVHTIQFWDALDFIGVSGYYPLVNADAPTKAQLVEAWKPVVQGLEKLSLRWKKPVLFTELGYRSADRAAWKQWELEEAGRPNTALQADAYAAFFEAVWPKPWVAGVYWWRAHSYRYSDRQGTGFEIDGKPAAEVLRTYYRHASAKPPAAAAR
jgi:hypothetical protein